jgi:hypothetical protein
MRHELYLLIPICASRAACSGGQCVLPLPPGIRIKVIYAKININLIINANKI